MTERERWIVYPLLFLALGAALRDKLVDSTTLKSIVCQELTVVDEEPIGNRSVNILAKIGRSEPEPGRPSTGFLFVNGHMEVAGAVNAKQYAYNGVPFVPALPAGLGIPLPDFLRAMQEAAQRKQSNTEPNANAPQPSPRAPPPEPLADPDANR